jgi:thiol-disulfide isomerase/thioredoxin
MKNFRIYSAFVVLGLLFSFSPDYHDTANAVLERVSAKLANTKYLTYYHKRVISDPAVNDENSFEGEVYLDYRTPSAELDCRFQFQNSRDLIVFNGSEVFQCNKLSKTLMLEKNKKSSFNNYSFLYNSLYSLRKVLPIIIEDNNMIKIVGDTIVDNIPLTKVSFSIHDALIDNLGIIPSEKGAEFKYQLMVDKKSSLPYLLIRQSNRSQSILKVYFTQIKELVDDKADQSWYYSSYQPEYKMITKEKLTLVQPGVAVGDWTLPLYGASKKVDFKTDYKGKFLLMEFWIRNCAYCIAGVNTLNEIQEVYGKDKLAIVGVNVDDPESRIGEFIKRYHVSYPIVSGGDSLRRALGVGSYPAVVLVGPDRKVVYADGIDKEKLKKVLKDAL